MTRPLFTAYSNHPRLSCRDTDKTAITTRTNAAASWQSVWDNKVIAYANNALGKTDATLAAEGSLDSKFFTLGLAGWIDDVLTYYNKLKSTALNLANNSALWDNFTARREQIIGLAVAYDFLRAGGVTGGSFSDADRKTIGDAIIALCTQGFTESTADFINGHLGGNFMSQLYGGLALANESGAGFNFTTSANGIINTALDYWYGQNAGSKSRLESDQYWHGDGGSGKGTWYNSINNYHNLFLLNALTNGCSSITISGDAYVPFTDEMWVQKIPEFWIRAFLRGDKEYLTIGDTGRTYPSPFYHIDSRIPVAIMITRGGTWRKPLRWTRDIIEAQATTAPFSSGNYDYAWEVAIWDPADANNVSVSPKNVTPALSKIRLFDPPGECFYDSSLDIFNGIKIHIRCPEYYYYGHTHLDCGSMQIYVRDDPVLTSSGRYDTSDTNADFGGSHHRNWFQQSIAQSGAILIDQPGRTHTSRNAAGSQTEFPSGLGGQMWKKFDPGTGITLDPEEINAMRNHGGKMAWRRSGIDMNGADKFRIVSSLPSSYYFLHADFTYAYLRNLTELSTPNQIVINSDFKVVIIENVSINPIILCVYKARGSSPVWKKRQAWHTYGIPTVTSMRTVSNFTPSWRTTAPGRKGIGKIVIDVYDVAGATMSVIGGGPQNSAGYANNQFRYGGVNYPPLTAGNPREESDIGKFTTYSEMPTSRETDYFVSLVMPMLVGESPPTYSWIDETNFFGVQFGSISYRIHKTQTTILTDADMNPPSAPTGLVATTGPASQQVTLNWNPNTEGDISFYVPYYRLKV